MSRTVAIVGRPNVGKSALFNRLAGRKISIVHDMPGVTRDRIAAECRLGREPFEILDTGGIGAGVDADFTEQVHAEVEIAIADRGPARLRRRWPGRARAAGPGTRAAAAAQPTSRSSSRSTRSITTITARIRRNSRGSAFSRSSRSARSTTTASRDLVDRIDALLPAAGRRGRARRSAGESGDRRPAECRQILADQCHPAGRAHAGFAHLGHHPRCRGRAVPARTIALHADRYRGHPAARQGEQYRRGFLRHALGSRASAARISAAW